MLERMKIEFGVYLNADDIARTLFGPPEWVSRKAQQIVRDRREAALSAGRDHAFETVMSHPSHIAYMAKAAELGFEVRLFFVGTESPSINLDRVANRVLHGGHPVPPDRIVERYHRCLENLPAAIRTAQICYIFDNSSTDSPLSRLARIGPHLQLRHDRHKPQILPVWWLKILTQINPVNPFGDGILA